MIAENVAEGPSAEFIHTSWMNSPHHRANLLDPDLTAIGISVVLSADHNGRGMLFAVQDFSQSVARLNVQQQGRRKSARNSRRVACMSLWRLMTHADLRDGSQRLGRSDA